VNHWRRLADLVAAHGAAALVTVHEAKGSVPREAGARMVVRPDGAFHGTIGGGRLEWEMLALARQALGQGRGPARFVDQALGPDLGQCCGGFVTVLIETFDRRDTAELEALAAGGAVEAWLEDGRVRRGSPSPSAMEETWREPAPDNPTPVLLFGAGHVGRALVLALAPLPFAVRWIDSRPDAFPPHIPGNATPVHATDLAAEIAAAPGDALILVMTHDHALDLAVTASALGRGFPFVGLIGSGTKRARFEKRYREIAIPEERIAALVCPIGLPGIAGKEPATIAASVAAQLLQQRR
jgi:xanthine dehydrogenase accessory factor